MKGERYMEQNIVTETSESQTEILFMRIVAEPESRDILYKILAYCEGGSIAISVENQIRVWIANRSILHTPKVLLILLVESGGLQKVNNDDGQIQLHTTSIGLDVVKKVNSSLRIEKLLSDEPKYRDIFFKILCECVEPKSLFEIEDAMSGNTLMEKDNILASYFVSELEDAGGLEWNIKWKTTPSGIDAVAVSGL